MENKQETGVEITDFKFVGLGLLSCLLAGIGAGLLLLSAALLQMTSIGKVLLYGAFIYFFFILAVVIFSYIRKSTVAAYVALSVAAVPVTGIILFVLYGIVNQALN